MRGPIDEMIEEAEPGPDQPDERAGARATAARPRRKPPGGKPLLRLLQLLEGAGYTDAAATTAHAAVREPDAREALREEAQSVTAAPQGRTAVGEARVGAAGDERADARGARRRPRRGAAEEGEAEEEPTDADAAATSDAGQAATVGEMYLAAAEQLMGPPTGTGPQWRSLGPWTVPNGQTYGSSRVNVSGRVSALAVDPRDPAHVLCGAANGGVWESRDRGASWAPRTDYMPTLAVGALAFDPRTPTTVYCGTGEGNWWSFLGAGVLRSTNGGTTWAVLCTAPFVGQGFFDLIVDPSDGRRLFAATTGGLYTSVDGGATWTLRRAVRTWSIACPAAGSAGELLAACSDGVWRSTDRGATWAAVALRGTPGAFDRLAVAIAPTDARIAYAWGARGTSAYLWRRAGGAWTAVAPPPGVATAQAWYDWFLGVSPDNAGQIYCGAIEVHRGTLAGAAWSWLNITNKGAAGDSIHPDQHVIAFEPGRPDVIYVGNDGGVFQSPNRGVNWVHRNNGLVISEFEYLAQQLGSTRWLLGGTQDNGTNRWNGATWEHVADGDGGDCAVNRTTPNTVFHTYYNMSPERSTTGGGWGSWTYLPPSLPSGEGSLFYPPMECSASGGDTLAIGGDSVYVSRNNATNWTRVALPAGARSSAMYIPNANTVYVGVTDGRVFRSTWGGAAWGAMTALTTPRANAMVSDLFVDPANPNRLWATYRTTGGGRVFRSDNGGATWMDRTAGLSQLPINAIEVDPANANRVWVAADLGVFETTDGGATWRDFSNGLPNMFIGDLIFHPHARVLRAGTRNRGVWEIPVDGWMTRPQCGVQFNGTLAANQTMRWFTFGWPATWHMLWTAMPTTVRPGAPQLQYTVQVERAGPEHVTYWISVTNLTPVPVSFEGRYCILSRY